VQLARIQERLARVAQASKAANARTVAHIRQVRRQTEALESFLIAGLRE